MASRHYKSQIEKRMNSNDYVDSFERSAPIRYSRSDNTQHDDGGNDVESMIRYLMANDDDSSESTGADTLSDDFSNKELAEYTKKKYSTVVGWWDECVYPRTNPKDHMLTTNIAGDMNFTRMDQVGE